MSGRYASMIAWAVWLLVAAMTVAYVLLSDDLVYSTVMLTFATVGVFVASRRPDNPQGWVLLAYGFIGLLGETGGLYAQTALGSGSEETYPFWKLGTVVYPAGWMIGNAVLWMGFLLFPNGELVSPRWRWALRMGSACLAAIAVLVVLAWPLRGEALLTDDFGLPGAAGSFLPVPLSLMYGTALLSAVSLIVRFRRSRGEERLQLKWLVSAVTVLIIGLLAIAASGEGPGEEAPLAVMILLAGGMLSVPVAMGVAILRYRLYEIDRIIHRTTVYALVTAVLGGTYLGLVVSIQSALRPVTDGSDLAVATSTLAVAAAFGPVRNRVQMFVDRRFNRRRFDAQQEVAAFSGRLRDSVDLRELVTETVSVAGRTVQPAGASLWLRSGGDT